MRQGFAVEERVVSGQEFEESAGSLPNRSVCAFDRAEVGFVLINDDIPDVLFLMLANICFDPGLVKRLRTVVHDNDFNGGIILSQDGIQAFFYEFAVVVEKDDDGKNIIHGTVSRYGGNTAAGDVRLLICGRVWCGHIRLSSKKWMFCPAPNNPAAEGKIHLNGINIASNLSKCKRKRSIYEEKVSGGFQ